MSEESETAATPPEWAAPRSRSLIEFDEIDATIIARLRVDGRTSNRSLAAVLGVNEERIRSRIKRLEDAGMMRVVTVVDYRAMGYKYYCPVGVSVKGRPVADVAADLAAIANVATVNIAIGERDIELQLLARSLDELTDSLLKQLFQVPGVIHVEPALALRILKYDLDWVPFT